MICRVRISRAFSNHLSRVCYREVVEMILKTGFDINVRTSRGTALHEAAICGKVGLLMINTLFTY